MKTLIRNGWILTMDPSMKEYRKGSVLIEDDHIAAVGELDENIQSDRTVDAEGCIVMPGMVNTHCHVPMIPFRSLGDDCPDRLRRFLFPLENACMNENLTGLSAAYGMTEMMMNGITTFADMYYYPKRIAAEAEKAGIRAVIAESVIDQPSCDAADSDEGFRISEEFIRSCRSDLVTPAVSLHADNTVSAETFRRGIALADQYDVMVMSHVAEMDYEMDYFRREFGMTPVEWLDSIGCLSPRLLAVHCIHLSSHDISLLKKRGVSVSYCPGSNLKAGKGVAPLRDLVRADVPAGFGTDGASSGNTLELFTLMRMAACSQKTRYHDRSLFPAKELVRIATMGGARALHMDDRIGSLEAGKKADVVIVSLDAPHMFPVHDPYSVLVYSANPSDVRDVFISGRQTVADGKSKTDFRILRVQLEEAMQDFTRMAEEMAEKKL